MMELRKLEQKEHSKTRNLWETVFSEDTKQFLDYYYFLKTRDNEIYAIEEDKAIRSMLHLNPYMLQVEEQQFRGNYIIAVATEEAYRSRGYMGMLLRKSMEEMYRRKEWFTFLMPAAEAIYTPYDFRFINNQRQALIEEIPEYGFLSEEKSLNRKLDIKDASIGDAAEMAVFFNQYFADRWQVYAVRNEAYYQTLLFEQQSENGGIKLMESDGELVGMFDYAREDGLEIREPLYLNEYAEEFKKAVYAMQRGSGESVKVYAPFEEVGEEHPIIMARILYLPGLLSAMKVKEGEQMGCSFAVLDTILTQNSRIWRIWGGYDDSRKIHVQETEDSEGVLTIGALTSLLFGYKTIEEIRREENVILPEHLAGELGKLQVLDKVFLNEIV